MASSGAALDISSRTLAGWICLPSLAWEGAISSAHARFRPSISRSLAAESGANFWARSRLTSSCKVALASPTIPVSTG